METFYAHNPEISSRIQVQFRDYEDVELLHILEHRIREKYNGIMKIEGGFGGLYFRIVADQLTSEVSQQKGRRLGLPLNAG